jgi:hypothetical protein
LAIAAALSLPTAWAGTEGKITSPSGALLSTTEAQKWNFGVDYLFAQRDIEIVSATRFMESQQLMARFGYEVFPFLNLQVGAGWCQAQLDERKGDSGVALSAAATASLAEYIIDSSPVLGKKQSVAILFTARYLQSQSGFDEGEEGDKDFAWHEVQLLPAVRYFINLEGPENWQGYDPTGVAATFGPLVSDLRGEFGTDTLEGERNTGLLLGFDMRFFQGWVFNFTGMFYDSNDRSLSIGAGYYF